MTVPLIDPVVPARTLVVPWSTKARMRKAATTLRFIRSRNATGMILSADMESQAGPFGKSARADKSLHSDSSLGISLGQTEGRPQKSLTTARRRPLEQGRQRQVAAA